MSEYGDAFGYMEILLMFGVMGLLYMFLFPFATWILQIAVNTYSPDYNSILITYEAIRTWLFIVATLALVPRVFIGDEPS